MEKVYVGAAYYPELWDEAEIDKDIERCKDLGINTLRVAEFAWSKMEPEEGKLQLDWLVKLVDKLYENGIYTLMCTPTCTPPRWFLDKYEEVRVVEWNSRRQQTSSRCHCCKTSRVMRDKNAYIVTAMAKALKNCKGIIGWQLDNEIFPYGDGCFCENCQKAFREYLKKKFSTIDALNQAWGMYRWSLDYADFDAVMPPLPNQWRHPSLRKAWWDFQCYQIKTYLEEQAEIIRRYSGAPIGTDMMQNNNLGYVATNRNLDVIMFNHYNDAKSLADNSFSYDFLRTVKDRPFWVTETQVGWNGSEFAASRYRPVGNCYVNTWMPLARGAEMNLYWLFRTHPNGHEIAHGALYSASGREHRVTDEVRQVCRDLVKCGSFLANSKVNSKIALHYSSEAANCFQCAPLVEDFKYRDKLLSAFYKPFRHCNVDVIDESHSLDGYDTVISPFLAVIDEDLENRIKRFVRDGGTWIVGPMSDIYNGELSKFTRAPYRFLEEFAGVYTKYQKPLDNDVFKAVWNDGTKTSLSTWYDAYECREAVSLAKYCEGEFKGYTAVALRSVGKGKVILLGSVIDADGLLRLAGANAIMQASDNLLLTKREGKENGVIVTETENAAGFVQLDGAYVDLITGSELSGRIEVKPHQVLVLVKKQ